MAPADGRLSQVELRNAAACAEAWAVTVTGCVKCAKDATWTRIMSREPTPKTPARQGRCCYRRGGQGHRRVET